MHVQIQEYLLLAVFFWMAYSIKQLIWRCTSVSQHKALEELADKELYRLWAQAGAELAAREMFRD